MPELRVRRDDISTCELVEGESRRGDLAAGEAQLLIERFALSANNVSYATLGDRLGYWRIFPAAERWGRIPAWVMLAPSPRARRRLPRVSGCPG